MKNWFISRVDWNVLGFSIHIFFLSLLKYVFFFLFLLMYLSAFWKDVNIFGDIKITNILKEKQQKKRQKNKQKKKKKKKKKKMI